MNVYTPASELVVHEFGLDLVNRPITKPVHIVQGDNKLPILAIKLRKNGIDYAVPSNVSANIRLTKPDHTFVYNPALGTDSTKTILYFEITQKMASVYGKVDCIVELMQSSRVIGSSPFDIIVDRNPIQEGDIESTDEWKTLEEYTEQAGESAAAAKKSETNAASSASAARNSEINAKDSENKSAESEAAAKTSEENAKNSETKAKESANKAETSAEEASEHESNAEQYSLNSKNSATESLQYANESKEYSEASKASADKSRDYSNNAGTFADSAQQSAAAAKTSETKAKESETNASNSKDAALESANKAAEAAESVVSLEQEAKKYSDLSKSYAVGKTETRENEDVDNSQYYYEQTKKIAQGLQGTMIPMGTINFEELKTVFPEQGWMYNIRDSFTTDDTFEDGPGYFYGAGSNVYFTGSGKWDVMAPISVTGVKGSSETYYHQGNVDISADNVGAYTKSETDKKISDGTVNFVKKTGDTMSGPLTLSGDVAYVNYNSGSRNGHVITLHKRDNNGSDVVIGEGGPLFIGGGESAASLHTANSLGFSSNTENTFITADADVFLMPNCNTIANRRPVVFFGELGYKALGVSSSDTKLYFKELIKYICRVYNVGTSILAIGIATPNSKGFCIVHVYDGIAINDEGLPRYSNGMWYGLNETERSFGTYDYAYRYNELTSRPSLLLTGGTLTGALTIGSSSATKNLTVNGNATVSGTISEGGSTLANKYAPKSHTHSYLSLSGGTLTGSLTLNADSLIGIKYKNSVGSFSPILFYKGNASGSGIVIGGGGRTIVGGGESAASLHAALVASTGDQEEKLYLASDGNVEIDTNCDTIANRVAFTFTTGGKLVTPNGLTLTTHGGGWISGKTATNMPIYISNKPTASYYFPIITFPTVSSHYVSLGQIDDTFNICGYLSSRTVNGTDWRTYWNVADGTINHNRNLVVAGTISEGGSTLANKYAPKSHTHSYLSLSGGTLTGPVNIGKEGDNYVLGVYGAIYLHTKKNTGITLFTTNYTSSILQLKESGTGVSIGIGSSNCRSLGIMGDAIKYTNSSGSGSISDERAKKDWKDLNDYDLFFDKIEPKAFKYINGTSDRYHLGFNAQSIEKALSDSALTNKDFGGLVISKVDPEDKKERGIDYDDEYSLIYTEFIALLTDQIQKLKARVADLEFKMERMNK